MLPVGFGIGQCVIGFFIRRDSAVKV
jgi:hypothetical protein